jgi:hypothetical protein
LVLANSGPVVAAELVNGVSFAGPAAIAYPAVRRFEERLIAESLGKESASKESVMTKQFKATFQITGWDETPFDESSGVAKLTEALVSKTYEGDIEGTSTTKWLMAYAPDKSATFIGLERIKGTVGGKHGSLVLQHTGTFADGSADASLTVVSGTNELKSVSGRGDFKADPAGSVVLRLDFDGS